MVPVQQAIDEANDDPENVPIKKDSILAKMNILWG
jgi:amino acid transporter